MKIRYHGGYYAILDQRGNILRTADTRREAEDELAEIENQLAELKARMINRERTRKNAAQAYQRSASDRQLL